MPTAPSVSESSARTCVSRQLDPRPPYGRRSTPFARTFGDLSRPPRPRCGAPVAVTVFPYGDYERALRLMTSGQHQGKLVLKAPPAPAAPDFPIDDRRPLLDPEGTYLVTGGLGGFGQRILPYLVTAGARHLTLLDRDPERRRSESWLRQSTTLADIGEGVDIDIVPGDVAQEADVRRCVDNVRRPLKGVFHLAGTLDDRLLADLSPESITKVFAPKARGALNLHRATAGLALDHFVMVSSTSSIIGNPGQINYSAANAYLDGLAVWRRRQGLPALTYCLAAVSDAGMAARNLGILRLMKAAGMPPVSSHFAIANLDYALRTMGESDHLITALFKRQLWGVNSDDYMRTGRLISNQDAFEVGSDERLTVETVMAQIAAKVAELCGHDEGGPGRTALQFWPEFNLGRRVGSVHSKRVQFPGERTGTHDHGLLPVAGARHCVWQDYGGGHRERER